MDPPRPGSAKTRPTALYGSFEGIQGRTVDRTLRQARGKGTEDYGETRFIGLGRIDLDVYRIIYTWRGENVVRTMRARGEDQTRSDAPEAESLGEEFWKTARVVLPRGKTSVHLRLDSDVVEWFRPVEKGI